MFLMFYINIVIPYGNAVKIKYEIQKYIQTRGATRLVTISFYKGKIFQIFVALSKQKLIKMARNQTYFLVLNFSLPVCM